MTFDANHLIRMAEQRGLFGKPVKGRKQKIPSPVILMSLTTSDEPKYPITIILVASNSSTDNVY